MNSNYRYSTDEYIMQGQISSFIYRVYGWMAAALTISAAIAYYVFTQPSLYTFLFKNTWSVVVMIAAQFALVLGLGLFIARMSYSTAVILFMLYAASVGLTLSSIFFVYTMNSIYLTFFVTAGMFGSMAAYGYVTQRDLSRIGSIATMALWGLILGFLINLYFKNSTADYIFSAIGVLIFTALTAFDMQKIKQIGYQMLSHEEGMRKVAVLGAMTLYLDFLNLFLLLLRFTGQQRSE
jgi:uncharacterized protein